MDKTKKIWFFRYDTWQHSHVYLPHTWYEFKRYYELNGNHTDKWDWIPPVENYENWSIDQIVEEAVSHNADVYMFSSYMWAWETIKIVANGIRQELPNAVIVLGGPHQHTTYTQQIFWFKDHPYFDATCRPNDFGEFFIKDMLDAIAENNLDWSIVRGSYHRKGLGPEGNKRDFKYPTNIIGANIEHARKIAKTASDSNKKLGIMYETNRGCMYKCVYCEWGGGTNTKVVQKETDNILDDVSYFRELKIHTIWLTDANFGLMKRDPDLAKLFASQNDYLRFVGITGLAKTKSDKRAAVLEPLMEAGLVTLYQISLQTIDEQTLENIIRTDVTPEENVSLAKYLIGKYDIDVIVELILGLPGMKVETFYKEAAIEYSLMNSVKPHTHHVPLYVLPDAPVADPNYLDKFNIKLAPISFEESARLLEDTNSKYIQTFREKNYKRENTLHIPISSYSYTVEDWKEMFFMNDMNHVFMNMIMITPFIDFLHYHRDVPLDLIFKKLFLSLASVDNFYKPVYNEYLTPLANGEYWNRSWRQFNAGTIQGHFTVHASYAYLWSEYRDEIYEAIRKEFSEYVDEMVDDLLDYCKFSTLGVKKEVVWQNNYRWDDWEEAGNKYALPVNIEVILTTKPDPTLNWTDYTNIYRNKNTVRLFSNEPIKMKLFQITRAGND